MAPGFLVHKKKYDSSYTLLVALFFCDFLLFEWLFEVYNHFHKLKPVMRVVIFFSHVQMSQFRCEEVWIPQRLGFYHISIIKEKGNKRVPVFKRHDYKQCCDEHWGTRVSQFCFPWCVCPAVGLLGHKALLFPVF